VHVLLLENIHQSAHELLAAESFRVDVQPAALSPAALLEAVRDVHVLGIRSKSRITPDVLAAAPELLAVGCFCIGTNQVELGAARDHGVPVFNAPFSNTRSVAEMVLGEIVMLSRQLGDQSAHLHRGVWRKVAAGCHEVRGKVLGIIGYGHIGSQVGVLAEAFGMRVAYFDIAAKLPMGNNRSCGTMAELLAQADFVTLHVPATSQTHNLIGAEELAQMKPGSYLLNASRGSVVNLEALVAALRSGHLAGCAVDVFPEEPDGNSEQFTSELQELQNVVLTPHIGGSTVEAQAAIGREVAASLIGFINRGTTAGSVNFPQVELPPARGTHRLVNVHRNVPGVLRDINLMVSNLNANIHSQMLSTDASIGYLVMDLDQNVSHEVGNAIAGLETSIRTRILY
jgi:D-3-phosphoglycerate dehydrogenase / 2-oxoglutarate reductase